MAEENFDGIPDADLSSVQADLEKEAEKESADLGQFKTAEDLLKSYKEIQGAFTRVTQENKSLKEMTAETEQLKAEMDVLREQQMMSSSAPQQTQKDFDESWMENPENAIKERVNEAVRLARIEDVLAEEELKNPEEYQERYNYADQLGRKNPQLARTPAGVRMLFKQADDIRVKALTANSKKSFEMLFGQDLTDDDIATIRKKLLGKKQKQSNNDAYMPDGSTSTKSNTDADADQDNSGAIKEAVNKGDVDGVLDEIFKDISA